MSTGRDRANAQHVTTGVQRVRRSSPDVAGSLESPDLLVIPGRRFEDHRGHFSETYSRAAAARLGITCDFVQDNEALSRKPGTLRGLHFQRAPSAQAKLVRVVSGAIFDVVVDVRAGSPSFGKWRGVTLTAESAAMLFVPVGFAHAYVTIEPNTLIAYKVDHAYDPSAEAGIRWDDPEIGIAWPLPRGGLTISDKDARLPYLRDLPASSRL